MKLGVQIVSMDGETVVEVVHIWRLPDLESGQLEHYLQVLKEELDRAVKQVIGDITVEME